MIDYRLDGLSDCDVLSIARDEGDLIISVSELKSLEDDVINELLNSSWSIVEPFVFPI